MNDQTQPLADTTAGLSINCPSQPQSNTSAVGTENNCARAISKKTAKKRAEQSTTSLQTIELELKGWPAYTGPEHRSTECLDKEQFIRNELLSGRHEQLIDILPLSDSATDSDSDESTRNWRRQKSWEHDRLYMIRRLARTALREEDSSRYVPVVRKNERQWRTNLWIRHSWKQYKARNAGCVVKIATNTLTKKGWPRYHTEEHKRKRRALGMFPFQGLDYSKLIVEAGLCVDAAISDTDDETSPTREEDAKNQSERHDQELCLAQETVLILRANGVAAPDALPNKRQMKEQGLEFKGERLLNREKWYRRENRACLRQAKSQKGPENSRPVKKNKQPQPPPSKSQLQPNPPELRPNGSADPPKQWPRWLLEPDTSADDLKHPNVSKGVQPQSSPPTNICLHPN